MNAVIVFKIGHTRLSFRTSSEIAQFAEHHHKVWFWIWNVITDWFFIILSL